jgi:hypothetical protein
MPLRRPAQRDELSLSGPITDRGRPMGQHRASDRPSGRRRSAAVHPAPPNKIAAVSQFPSEESLAQLAGDAEARRVLSQVAACLLPCADEASGNRMGVLRVALSCPGRRASAGRADPEGSSTRRPG